MMEADLDWPREKFFSEYSVPNESVFLKKAKNFCGVTYVV